jgi:alkylation response protein AidB-like acyl-CoA dehydrogenase
MPRRGRKDRLLAYAGWRRRRRVDGFERARRDGEDYVLRREGTSPPALRGHHDRGRLDGAGPRYEGLSLFIVERANKGVSVALPKKLGMGASEMEIVFKDCRAPPGPPGTGTGRPHCCTCSESLAHRKRLSRRAGRAALEEAAAYTRQRVHLASLVAQQFIRFTRPTWRPA